MLDVLIDKLTNSVEEVATGRSFDTQITTARLRDIRSLDHTWCFDWTLELKRREVFKLTIPQIGSTIQGLISLSREPEYIKVNLIESNPANVGHAKKFARSRQARGTLFRSRKWVGCLNSILSTLFKANR